MLTTIQGWLDEGKISYSAYLNVTNKKAEHEYLTATDSQLKISVLISTYKRSAYLIRLLDSIRDQGYKNYEIIIVDDASNDDTEQTVNQYREENPDVNIIYMMNQTNMGASKSRKRAYLKASGDIVIFVDDDDYFIEPSYFSMLTQLYEKHPDCVMTIASTIQYIEQEEKYEYIDLNVPGVLSTQEYLNGFMGIYRKPSSTFAMSLNNAIMKGLHYDELMCFNDTSLYLFGLLGKGNVYAISQAVGIYNIHAGSITGNTTPEFIVANLESKEYIYLRAKNAGILNNPKEWHYRNMLITSGYHLASSHCREDKKVWKWMKEHLNWTDYCRFTAKVMKSRIVRRLKMLS